ncbi:hypothetical protein CLOM_g9119 [Closterium sp. NIES-68]|nr:hypothetical protein CLOM_g9119 [Closterium sp. NIES-68]
MAPSLRAIRATFVCLSLNLTLCNVFNGRHYTAPTLPPPASSNIANANSREGESAASAGFVLPSSARSCDEDEMINGAKGLLPSLQELTWSPHLCDWETHLIASVPNQRSKARRHLQRVGIRTCLLPLIRKGTRLFKLLPPPSPLAPLPSPCDPPSPGRGGKLLLGGTDLCALMHLDGGSKGWGGGGGGGAGERRGGRRGVVGDSQTMTEKKGGQAGAEGRDAVGKGLSAAVAGRKAAESVWEAGNGEGANAGLKKGVSQETGKGRRKEESRGGDSNRQGQGESRRNKEEEEEEERSKSLRKGRSLGQREQEEAGEQRGTGEQKMQSMRKREHGDDDGVKGGDGGDGADEADGAEGVGGRAGEKKSKEKRGGREKEKQGGHMNKEMLIRAAISQMQAKKFNDAIKLFNLVEAEGGEMSDQLFIGRGLCHLFLRQLDDAEDDFTEGIRRYPQSAELYRRRAVLYIERNEREAAVEDYSRALEIEPNHLDALQNRGTIAFHLHFYSMAISDLSKALELRPMDPFLIRAKGIALAGSGQWRNASAVFAEAVKRHPMSANLWTEKGRVHKELGEVDLALAALHKALALEDTLEAYIRLTSLMQLVGRHREVINTARRGLKLSPDDIELNYLEASAHHALGDFEAALVQYSRILGFSPTDSNTGTLQGMAFYQREIAAYTVAKLDLPFTHFRLDYELDNDLKEAWVRKQSPLTILPTYRPLPYFVDGFMPHKRQHRMAGLAALDLMQRVNATWQQMIEEQRRADGEGEGEGGGLGADEAGERGGADDSAADGNDGDDVASSDNTDIDSETDNGSSERGGRGRRGRGRRATGRGGQRGSRRKTPRVSLHSSSGGAKRSNGRDKPARSPGRSDGAKLISGWRDMFDGIIRWRQHAEPCDTITWIDQLKNEYPRGFGTITAMRVGQMHNLKYYPFQDWAFEVMRSVLLETEMASNATNWPLPVPRRVHGRAIEAARDFGDLHRSVGENFYVTTQCYSEAFPGRIMNGTQLTLVESSGSYDFTIRTAVTPERSAEFFQELQKTWEELSLAAADTRTRATDIHLYRQRVREGVLRMGYYWYQFMPLTRGSAMVGIISILGLSLAADMETLSLIPKDTQVDWEAILNPRFKHFNDSVSPWFYRKVAPSPWHLPRVSEALPTTRHVIAALSYDLESDDDEKDYDNDDD